MRSIIVLVLLLLLLVVGCASRGGVDPNYAAYLQASQQADQREQLARAAIGDAAASCGNDATCVVAVAGFAALAAQASGQSAALQPYRKQYHPAWGILGAVAPALVNGAVSVRQSDNARDIALGQYDFLGGVISSVTSSPALLPRDPSITVGGDQHVGDAIGGSIVGRDQIGRDVIGGDRVDNSGVIGNDNRFESPGPIDHSGDNCTGELCQGSGDTNPPPVEPEG